MLSPSASVEGSAEHSASTAATSPDTTSIAGLPGRAPGQGGSTANSTRTCVRSQVPTRNYSWVGPVHSPSVTGANAERLEQILGMLRDRGGRVTTSRRAIISSLLGSGGHVTADELTSEIQANFPDIHLSTIY